MYIMEILNGREESLDGRFIVYSKVKTIIRIDMCRTELKETLYGAFYSNDKTALFNKFPEMESKMKLGLENNLELIFINDKSFVSREYAADFLSGKYNLIIGQQISLENENFSDFTEDIVFAGNYGNTNDARENIINCTREYYEELRKQEICPVAHQDFCGKPLGLFIKERYINKMLTATRIKDYYIFYKVKDQFITFSEGSYFKEKAKELCNVIEYFNFDKIDENLINKYILTINALHKEDFETAGSLNKKIESDLIIKGIDALNA
jgi:hypothetical protein